MPFIRSGTSGCWNKSSITSNFPASAKLARLSNGQRAQVSLALAIAPDPELLILDDPTLGLDTVVRRDFLESMIQIIQKQGRTILFSSHILGDVDRVADRIGIMVDGVLRVDCPTEVFKESVRAVLLEFAGPPPEFPACKGLVSSRAVGRRRELVFVGFGEEQRRIAEALTPAPLSIDEFELNLEDAFVEYTRGRSARSRSSRRIKPMYKALTLKELRETGWIALLALLIYGFMLADLMGYSFLRMRWEPVDGVPFFRESFLFRSALIATVFGVLLGFRQSAWESIRGTSVFLLHRPMPRGAVFSTKLAAGIALFLAATGVPLLVYALWAATPGTHASPFYWSMTGSSWIGWLAMVSVYLAAFLCGIRNARWFGSRLFPLIGIAVPVIAAMEIPVLIGSLATIVVTDAVLLAAIFRVAETREYP